MKKVLLGILLVSIASFANAQKTEINEARKAWNLLTVTTGKTLADHLNFLKTGLAHTDLAIANEKSKDLPDAWSYRALFASRIALIDSIDMDNSKANQKIAEEAIAKAKTLDTKGTEKGNIDQANAYLKNALRNRAVNAFHKKDLATALEAFNQITANDPNDTLMYVNAGVTANELKNYPEVVRNFKKAIDLNYKDSKGLYTTLINISFKDLKDSVGGLALLQEASAKYPDDTDFIGIETDLYIKKGDVAKSQEMLTKLIAKDPKKASYQVLMGDTYFKQALDLQEQRNAVDPKKTAEFNALNTKMTGLIDQSVPFYKAALALDPKNASALESLKTIYSFKNDKVNYEAIKTQLDAIKP